MYAYVAMYGMMLDKCFFHPSSKLAIAIAIVY